MNLDEYLIHFTEYVACACGNKVNVMISGDKYYGKILINLPNGKGVYKLPMVWNRYTGIPENMEEHPTNYYYRLVIKPKHRRISLTTIHKDGIIYQTMKQLGQIL